jgi:hypothetical protein
MQKTKNVIVNLREISRRQVNETPNDNNTKLEYDFWSGQSCVIQKVDEWIRMSHMKKDGTMTPRRADEFQERMLNVLEIMDHHQSGGLSQSYHSWLWLQFLGDDRVERANSWIEDQLSYFGLRPTDRLIGIARRGHGVLQHPHCFFTDDGQFVSNFDRDGLRRWLEFIEQYIVFPGARAELDDEIWRIYWNENCGRADRLYQTNTVRDRAVLTVLRQPTAYSRELVNMAERFVVKLLT